MKPTWQFKKTPMPLTVNTIGGKKYIFKQWLLKKMPYKKTTYYNKVKKKLQD